MRRVLFAGLVLIVGGLWVAIAEEPKEPSSALGRKLAKLQKKFEADKKALDKKMADAKEPDDKQQVAFLTKELYAFAASDAVELAEEGKKDEAGLDAAVFALKLLGKYSLTGPDMDKASAIVLENHIDSPKIAAALAEMVEAGPTGLTFIQTVAEKATNKEVQGLALYYQALALDAKATSQEGRSTEEYLTKLRTEAVDLIDKAVKTAPDAKVGDETLTKAAVKAVASLKFGVGFPVPDVEGVDLEGKKVKLSGYRGKVVLFDFWATWCGPCVAMIPHERELVSKMSDKPFAMLGVNVDDEKSALNEFLSKEKMPWNHWYDGSRGPLAKTFRVNAYPTLYLIDAKGVVRKKWIGSPGNEVLDKAVEELVEEAKKEKK
jgi:thiol-disulfide isomerase/thioredoxin